MRISDYQRRGVSIESLSLNALRNIDIVNIEEEKLIQKLVNQKLQRAPVQVTINRPEDKTDFGHAWYKGVSEKEFQKIINDRISSAKPQIEAADPTPVGDPPEPQPPIQVSGEQTLEKKIAKLKRQRSKLE